MSDVIVLLFPPAVVYVTVTLYMPPARDDTSIWAGENGDMLNPSCSRTTAPFAAMIRTLAEEVASPDRTFRMSDTGLGYRSAALLPSRTSTVNTLDTDAEDRSVAVRVTVSTPYVKGVILSLVPVMAARTTDPDTDVL